jgi:hypothetical protein
VTKGAIEFLAICQSRNRCAIQMKLMVELQRILVPELGAYSTKFRMISGKAVNDFREPTRRTRKSKFFGRQSCTINGRRRHKRGVRVAKAAVRIGAYGEPAGALMLPVAKRASYLAGNVRLMECMRRVAFLARVIHPTWVARFARQKLRELPWPWLSPQSRRQYSVRT